MTSPLALCIAEDIVTQYKSRGYHVTPREERGGVNVIDIFVDAPEQRTILGRFLGGLLGKQTYVALAVNDGKSGVSVSSHLGGYLRPGQASFSPTGRKLFSPASELSDILTAVERHHPGQIEVFPPQQAPQ